MEIRVGQTWNVVRTGNGIRPDQNPLTVISADELPGRYHVKTQEGFTGVIIQQWVDEGLIVLASDAVEPEPEPEPEPLELAEPLELMVQMEHQEHQV